MKCEVVQEKLSCYLDSAVDEATLEMIEGHLIGCSECRAELAALQTLTASIGTAAEVEPPTGLKSAIYDAIDQERLRSPECDTVLAFLSELLDGELDEQDRAMATEHIDSCEVCAREYLMMQRTVSAVGSLHEVDTPLTLKSHIAAAIASEKTPAFSLSGFIRTLSQAAEPAGRRWAVGSIAAAAILAIGLISPVKQGDVTMISHTPQARVGAAPTPPPAETETETETVAVAEDPVAPAVEVASVKRTPRTVVRSQKRSEPEATPAVFEAEHDQIALAPTVRVNGEDKSPASAPVASPAIHSVPVAENVDNAPNVKSAEVAITPEKIAPLSSDLAEAKKEVPKPETKPAEVQVAAQEPMVAPQDDQAMIRSLKQQIRMKQKGEGLAVDLLDVRF